MWILRLMLPNTITITNSINMTVAYWLVSEDKKDSIRTFLSGWVRGYAASINYTVASSEYVVFKTENGCRFVTIAQLAKHNVEGFGGDEKES